MIAPLIEYSYERPTRLAPSAAVPDYLAPVFAQYPLPVVGAEGVWLHTRDGRRVLDLYGGHAVAALGYGHPGWTRALERAGAHAELSRATRCRSRCARAPRSA